MDVGSTFGATNFISSRAGSHAQDQVISSPFTNRILKPYIRRDFGIRPLKLRLHEELLSKLGRKQKKKNAFPIDFCYLQPCHVEAVNSMARNFFWSGIDGEWAEFH